MKLISSLLPLLLPIVTEGGVINNNDIEDQDLSKTNVSSMLITIQEVMKLLSPNQNEKEVIDCRDLHPDIQFDSQAITVGFKPLIESLSATV